MKKQLLWATILFGSFAAMAQNPADRDNGFNVSGLGTPVFATGGQYSKITPLIDGKVLVTGSLYSAATTTPQYARILRLNNDGSFDNTFNVGGVGASGIIAATAVQSDGKIIIGGGFPQYNGTTVNHIARINADGTRDNTFNTGTGFLSAFPVPWVRGIAIQTDGKIIAVGGFTSYNGTAIRGVCRLNTDGTLDTTFDPGSGPNNYAESVAIQPDGKILVGGLFGSFNGISTDVARLNTDGSVDATFSADISGDVLRIVIQPDGKILTSGSNFYRLESNGSLDTGFLNKPSGNTFHGLALQTDGKIILSGFFDEYLSTPREHIVRLNTDGTVDSSFDSELGFKTNPNHIAIQPDGKILAYGGFEYKGVENMVTRIMGTSVPLIVGKNSFNNFKVTIFPNPTRQNINVTIEDANIKQEMNMSILNSVGQLVKQVFISHPTTTVDLKQLSPGIYYYQIKERDRIIKTDKIIIEH